MAFRLAKYKTNPANTVAATANICPGKEPSREAWRRPAESQTTVAKSWALNKPQVETRPPTARRAPSHLPHNAWAIAGQPASALQSLRSVVTLVPTTTDTK